MKKWITLGLLSLIGWSLSSPTASAFCCCRRWLRCCGETHITCRPYNAFTPICWGNLVCDGCCPSPCGVAGGCMPFQFMGGSPLGMANCCAPSCGNFTPGFSSCSDGSCLPAAPHESPILPGGPVAPPAPGFTPPPPSPSTMYYNPYANGVQRAGYYPGYYANYYQGYNPNAYNYAAAYQYYNMMRANPYYAYYYGYGR